MSSSNLNLSLDLYKVVLASLGTEKTNKMSDQHNRLSFKVANWANKPQIKEAIEKLFNVNVEKVSTINVFGKTRMFKQRKGKKSNWKKAIVRLQSGQDINMTKFVESI